MEYLGECDPLEQYDQIETASGVVKKEVIVTVDAPALMRADSETTRCGNCCVIQ